MELIIFIKELRIMKKKKTIFDKVFVVIYVAYVVATMIITLKGILEKTKAKKAKKAEKPEKKTEKSSKSPGMVKIV